MGSSDSGTGVPVDSTVGAIVWVRRRNGSWWPGKVVGSDEISVNHVMSPRTGTPVKLLGREDASVDWYNLEKSKRVKAFRCGEFDDCIEKVEASLGVPPKKRDKYARREDAILHALELEKQLLEKYGKLGSSSNGASSKLSHGVKKELVTSSEIMESGNGKHLNPISDDDNSDALPRMRGLQDFALKIDPRRESMILGNNKSFLDKGKRSDEGLFEEYLAKRRDKRRPMVQLLERSPMLQAPKPCPMVQVSQPLYLTEKSGDCLEDNEIRNVQMEVLVPKSEEIKSSHPAGPDEKDISGSTEDTETDLSETESVDTETDSDNTLDAFSDDGAPVEFIPKYLGRSESQRMSSEEPDDVTLPSGIPNFYNYDPDTASAGVSEWQMKGKRKIRVLPNEKPKPYPNETDKTENKDKTQMAGYGAPRTIKYWDEMAWNNQPYSKGTFWRDPPEHFDPNRRIDTTLIEVDLEVNASYQRPAVPLISLMSKLNGHAIVGHPIQVEPIESTFFDDFGPEVSDYDTAPPPMWSTARRTASSRVPRLQIRKPQVYPKLVVKPPKKINLSSSPKIRTLSSLAPQQTNIGLIKPEVGPTTVACIPVILVFSRLNEALGGRNQK